MLLSAVVITGCLCLVTPLMAADTMPLSEVHKGMRGYGESVFEGDTPVRFDVEIMGVLRNIGPGQDLILGRIDSDLVKETGVVAGMSGSPIYVDGKIIGALAYAWQFAKEPIAGITPIEQMLKVGERNGVGLSLGPAAKVSASDFISALVARDPDAMWKRLTATMPDNARPMSGGALPIAVPLSLSNFEASSIERFGSLFEANNLIPVSAGSTGKSAAGAPANTGFKPGDAIAAVLVDGDFSVAATGTVTYVKDGAVYGFGHPFVDMGAVDFPMARADVVGVLPNLQRSFKFSNTGPIVGALRQDRFSGIMGVVGADAKMVPVSVEVDEGGKEKTHNFRIARHPLLFPSLLALTTDSIVASTQKASGERTVVLDADIDVHDVGTVHLREGWAGVQARQAIPAFLGIISQYLVSNEFKIADIDSVKIRMQHADDLRVAHLLDATAVLPDDGKVRPGDKVAIRATMKPFRGEPFVETFSIAIPKDIPAGKTFLFVGGGSMMNRLDFAMVPPDPRSLGQVVDVIERLRPSTELSLALYSMADGVVTAGAFHPALPASMRQVMTDDTSNAPSAPVKFNPGPRASKQLDQIVDGLIRIDLDVEPGT